MFALFTIVLKLLYCPWPTLFYKSSLQESTFILLEAITRAKIKFNISSVVKNNLPVYLMIIFLYILRTHTEKARNYEEKIGNQFRLNLNRFTD